MKRFLIATMTGLIFTQLASAHASVKLGPDQLQHLAPGRYNITLMGVSSMTVTLRKNGTILGIAKGESDKGHWNLSGDKICIAWNKWLGGSPHCSELISQAGYYQGSGFTVTPL